MFAEKTDNWRRILTAWHYDDSIINYKKNNVNAFLEDKHFITSKAFSSVVIRRK